MRTTLAPRNRTWWITAALGGVTALLALLSLFSGRYGIDLREMLLVLSGEGSTAQHTIVVNLRLPRVLLAIVAGAALGVAGAIVQTTARNSLASPDLLGVTAGASTGAVAVIVLGGATGSETLRSVSLPVAAVVGGLGAALIVLSVLRRTGTHGVTPILVGIGISTLFSGFVSWLLIAADIDTLTEATVWLTGTLNMRSWPEVISVTLVLIACAIALLPLVRTLDTLTLGDEMAAALGVRLGLYFTATTVVAVLLSSVTTAAVGPVAFIALVSPHLARISAQRPRAGLVLSGTFGAAILLGSDLLARAAFPVQLPAGAITAVVGAPFLIFLLVRLRQEHR